MSQENNLTRRSAIKKGAVTATLLTGGVAATSTPAAASTKYASLSFWTDGSEGDIEISIEVDEYDSDPDEKITIYGDPIDPTGPRTERNVRGYQYDATVAGQKNDPDTPDNYVDLWVEGYVDHGIRSIDSNVSYDVDIY